MVMSPAGSSMEAARSLTRRGPSRERSAIFLRRPPIGGVAGMGGIKLMFDLALATGETIAAPPCRTPPTTCWVPLDPWNEIGRKGCYEDGCHLASHAVPDNCTDTSLASLLAESRMLIGESHALVAEARIVRSEMRERLAELRATINSCSRMLTEMHVR